MRSGSLDGLAGPATSSDPTASCSASDLAAELGVRVGDVVRC